MRHKQGKFTKAVEKRSSKVPAVVFLTAAAAAIAASATLHCLKKEHNALFVGQWAAPLLLLGIYARRSRMKGRR